MITLSNGKPSTLANYRSMALVLFGQDSRVIEWLDAQIARAPHHGEEEVLAPEEQMLNAMSHIASDKPPSGGSRDRT